MGKVEAIIKSEIVRLAKREMRKVATPLRRDLRNLKGTVSQLRKALSDLEGFITRQRKKLKQDIPLRAAPEEVESSRLSPKLIKSLRRRLGLSQRDLARIAGVTPLAVYQWESGVFKPKKEKKEILVALRKLGRRDTKKLLEEIRSGEEKKKVVMSKKKAKKESGMK